jgi:O-antigen ligase
MTVFFSTVLWVSLALSTASSKLAGVTWLVLVIWGLFNWWNHKNEYPTPNTASLASRTWLLVCLVALALRAVGVVYWEESWEERHAEIRLLLASLGAYGMLRFSTSRSHAVFDTGLFARRVSHAISLACFIGFGAVVTNGREALTTNAIPWAAGVAMLTIWLTHASLFIQAQTLERSFWALGALLGMLAVLVSESRGAYAVLLWVVLVLAWNTRRMLNFKRVLLGAGALLLGVGVLYKTPIFQQPLGKIITGITELQESRQAKADSQNSSVGARLVLWQLAKEAIPESPWVGYSQKQRLNMIHDWGRQQHSDAVTSLGHMHNQFLHDMMDHGLWGVTSDLMYLMGLAGLGLWLLKQRQSFAGLTLGGVAFIHATTSLTNVNFAHNYYPTMMAVAVGLALLEVDQQPLSKGVGR